MKKDPYLIRVDNRPLVDKLMEDYINGTQPMDKYKPIIDACVNDLPFPSLLEELKNYSALVPEKAMRVYRKCVLAKKFKIAARIRKKYSLELGKVMDDSVVAAAWAQIAISKP